MCVRVHACVVVCMSGCCSVAAGALAGQRGEVRERVAVWSGFTRSDERMETRDALLPRVGLERRNKNRVLIKGKRPEQQFTLNFLSFSVRVGAACGFYRIINHYPQV